jgi:hypothetical protein
LENFSKGGFEMANPTNQYQKVIAGRVREDEMPFVKNNKVATPSGTWSIKNHGGKAQPKIDAEFLETEFKGKKENRDVPIASAYNPNKNNAAH